MNGIFEQLNLIGSMLEVIRLPIESSWWIYIFGQQCHVRISFSGCSIINANLLSFFFVNDCSIPSECRRTTILSRIIHKTVSTFLKWTKNEKIQHQCYQKKKPNSTFGNNIGDFFYGSHLLFHEIIYCY